MSLARILCPDIASIPADVPYLKIDPIRLQHWRDYLGSNGQLKVGLVWRGNPKHENDRHRSIDLSELAPLLRLDGVQYFSLQKERSDRDAGQVPTDARWIDLAPQLHDFRDTAAAIAALDLVISVDTAVAHVAGALGKPVWVLLPEAADFRWLRDREDSPWYPTMRLLRQLQLGKWDEVVSRVEQALRIAVQEHRTGTHLEALLPSARRTAARELSVQPDSEPRSRVSALSRVVETRYGLMQYMPRGDDIARSIELYGEWLQPHVDLLYKLLRPGATVLEAPSGIGAHAIAVARLIGMAGHLIAYEEDPILKSILLRNIQGIKHVITVMKRQLVGPNAGQGEQDLKPASTRDVSEMARPAETETIDELLLERLDLIKLNECGHARAILEGAAATLWRLRPKLFLTVADADTLPLVDHARSFGYRCWRTESRLFNKDNFNRWDTDIFSERKTTALVAIPEETDIDMAAHGGVELLS